MTSENRDHTPSRITKNIEHPTTTYSYLRQATDRKISDELKDRTNQNNYQYGREIRQNKVSDLASRYVDRQNMTLMREYEALKLKVRQLETQNKHLETQLDKVDYEKGYLEKQYKQKIAFEQQSLLQFQKQKHYQIQLIQIKNQEDLSKLRRQNDYQLDQLQKQLKNIQYSNREKIQEINYLELRNTELKKQLEIVEKELIKSRENNSILNEQLTKEEFTNKKLSTLLQDMERQKNEMQIEIHVLLDIEAQKSRTINSLELQLFNTQASQRSLQDKVNHLTQNFTDLQSHITLMKQRMLQSDANSMNLEKALNLRQSELRQRDILLKEQDQREIQLREQLEIGSTKMIKRQRQVQQLMGQNERLYKQLNKARHSLHEVCINNGIQL